MSETSETNVNPSQQPDRRLKKYINKIKALTNQLKKENAAKKVYRLKISELEKLNNKLNNEVTTLNDRYKTDLMVKDTDIKRDIGEITLLTSVLQKTDEQNAYLRDELCKVLKNGNDGINDICRKCLDQDIIVDIMRQENDALKERNKYLESFVDRINCYLVNDKYKKRKFLEVSTKDCDEFGISYVQGIRALSLLEENKALRDENRTVTDFKKNMYKKMTGYILNVNKQLCNIHRKTLDLDHKLQNRIRNRELQDRASKDLTQYQCKLEEIRVNLLSFLKMHKQIEMVCIDRKCKYLQQTDNFNNMLNDIMERTMRYLAKSLIKTERLENEIKEYVANAEVYNELVDSLKVDFAELELENEELKKKLETNTNETLCNSQ